MTKQCIENIISGSKTNDEVRAKLRKAWVRYDDKSWTNDKEEVLNLYLKADDENSYLRIFKRHGEKEFTVGIYRKESFTYSGIPTFMPSGRNTFSTYF